MSDCRTLREDLEFGVALYNKIENGEFPNNSDLLNSKVDEAWDCLSRVGMASESAGLFSKNEELEEVPTNHLRFLSIPVYLSELIQRNPDYDKRILHLARAKEYLLFFLRRMDDYNLLNEKDLEVIKREGKEEMHVSREEKVQRFKEHKEAEMKIKFVKEKISRLNEDEDDLSSDIDELLREQCLAELELFITDSLNDLSNIAKEFDMLREIAKMRGQGVDVEKLIEDEKIEQSELAKKTPANIFTVNKRGEVRRGVFRNPNPWSKSIEEYIDEAIKTGEIVLPPPGANQPTSEEQARLQQEEEDIVKEFEAENDEAVLKQRHWDDYKDAVAKGSGNMKGRIG